jgi:hypothetical protein
MTITKKSQLLKLNFKLAALFTLFSINISMLSAQDLTTKQKDSAFLRNPRKERVEKFKKSFAKTFKDFVGNDLYLFGSLDLAKQTINDEGVSNPLNYLYNSVNSNSFKPGYSAGIRIDGIYKEKHPYSFIFAINRITTGNKYLNKYNSAPFLEDFTHFKADNQFTTFSIAAHYKKLLPISDMKKYKFYAVAGPSFDYKISKISNDNLVDQSSNRALINADLGGEFNNNDYYIIFAHYKLGTNLFNSAVPVQLNRFEIGMTIKAKDLF